MRRALTATLSWLAAMSVMALAARLFHGEKPRRPHSPRDKSNMGTCSRVSLGFLVVLLLATAGPGQTNDKGQPDLKAAKPAAPSLLDLLGGWQSGKVTGDPDAARLFTADIQNFWRAYDRATPKDLAEVLEREYLRPGSVGLQDFLRSRIKDADTLAKTINAYPKYYASIRESTLRVPALQRRIRASFYALKHLYPDAVFPDVYFVIGRMSSGGTTSSRGLLIGTEMYARTPTSPEAELTDWHKQVLGTVEDVPLIVAHELIHFQQKHPLTQRASLLAQSVIEGGADFLGELIAGGHINQHLHVYGNPREVHLWDEFRRDMDGVKVARWLYNGSSSKDRPADLGYYVGYKVVESYYGLATDKLKAIKEVLTIQDFARFLKDSGYEARIEKLRAMK